MNRYKNLDIDLLDYHESDEGESMRARVVFSPVGEQLDADAVPVKFPGQLRKRLKKLEQRALAFDELIELGEALAALLLPVPVRKIYRNCLAKLRDDVGLRIRIRSHAPELAALPWEYAYVSRPDVPPGRRGLEGFLALEPKLSLVRYEISGEAPTPIKPLQHYEIRAIALLADVKDPAYATLDLDREELNLRQALEGTSGIDARFLRPGSDDQLDAILSEDAQIFHFSGHGEVETRMGEEPGMIEGTGRLILSDENNHPEAMDAGVLALKLKGKGIRLVVLNACEAAGRDPVTPWSGIASTLAQQGIPAVVGMQYTIRDSSAIEFSKNFYRALANGASIDTAVSAGRQGALKPGGGEGRDWGVPVLYMRGSRSVLFPPPIVPLRRNLGLAIATIAFLSCWFYLHIYTLVEDKANEWMAGLGLGAGAVAGLLAIFKVIGSFASKTVKNEKEPILERWLRHRNAKDVLLTMLVASVVLFFTTHSIYLTHDSPYMDEIRLSIETEDNRPLTFRPEISTSSGEGDKLGGGPFFALPLPFKRLKLGVSQPDGWKLKAGKEIITPTFLRSVKLQAADIFINPGKLRVLRIAPGTMLAGILPAIGKQSEKTYQLKVTIDGEARTLDEFHNQIIVVGGPKALLEQRIMMEPATDRIASLEECQKDASAPQYSDAKIKYLETPQITGDSSITIELLGGDHLPFKLERSLGADALKVKTIKCINL